MSNATDPCTDPIITWGDTDRIVPAVLISLGSGLATSIGGAMVFFPQLLKSVSQKVVLAVALAISAGVMIYVSFIEIFVKSLDEISTTDGLSEGGASAITTVCFFGGMLICALLEVLVSWMQGGHDHHDHDTVYGEHGGTSTSAVSSSSNSSSTASPQVTIAVDGSMEAGGDEDLKKPEEQKRLQSMGIMTALAIAIHNFPEGLATFMATIQDEKVGASLGVAIAIHNIPEGLCVAMPIYYATGNPWKAFFWAFLSGLTEPIGGLLGFAVLQPVFTNLVFGIVFSMVGGMMVFIVCHELLPAAHRYMGNPAKATGYLITGMFIMAISLVMFQDFEAPANGGGGDDGR